MAVARIKGKQYSHMHVGVQKVSLALLVTRKDGSTYTRTWQGNDVGQTLERATRAYRKKVIRRIKWADDMDAYVLSNYYKETSTAIANHLREVYPTERVTHNAVISRYHTLVKRNFKTSQQRTMLHDENS